MRSYFYYREWLVVVVVVYYCEVNVDGTKLTWFLLIDVGTVAAGIAEVSQNEVFESTKFIWYEFESL